MKSTGTAEMPGQKLWRIDGSEFRFVATAENGGKFSRFSSAKPAG
jgi:hypothetical protein